MEMFSSLRSTFTGTLSLDEEINKWIGKAVAAFNKLSKRAQ